MNTARWSLIFFIIVALLLFTRSAEAKRQNPGSCVLFPYYDAWGNTISIHTITNVSDEEVAVRMIIVDEDECEPKDYWFPLIAGDTFTFAAHGIWPWEERGFMYLYVTEDMYSEKEKDADVLIGQEIVMGVWGHRMVQFSINAIGFQALHLVKDGKLHLDGTEYSAAPKTLYFPRFFGQDAGFFSMVILINLTGGMHFRAKADILIYNDNGFAFTDTCQFNCFEVRTLESLAQATKKVHLLNSGHDPNEPLPFANLAETGTLRISGDYAVNHTGSVMIENASILAVLVEGFGSLGYTGADLPLQIEDSNTYTNAMLWSTNPDGT
jgi:hypothetical protein